MDKFTIKIGSENNVLPGEVWEEYEVNVLDKVMMCINVIDSSKVYTIKYEDIEDASFMIGSGYLWLRLYIKDEKLIFTTLRKCWKSKTGKELVHKINSYKEITGMESYKKMIGKMFFFWIFK